MELEAIFAQVQAGDPVGAAYRLVEQTGAEASGRELYEAGSVALARRDELGDGALRFARIVFGEAVERAPDLAEAHHDLASTMRELGMAQDAIPHYRRALEIAPDDVDSLIGLGAAQCDAGQVDVGIATLRRATEEHPDNGHAFANLGVALEAVGRDAESVSAYAKAVARFDAALADAQDDEAAADAAMRQRWARIQHAQLLERLERWAQAVVEFRHLYEEERALAEAEEAAEENDDDDDADEDDDADSADGEVTVKPLMLDDGAPVEPLEDGSAGETVLSAPDAPDDEAPPGRGPATDDDSHEQAGRVGLERLFVRLVQLGRAELAYVVLDDLGGELADRRTRATYVIYDPGDGLPQILVEHWDGGEREKLDPRI